MQHRRGFTLIEAGFSAAAVSLLVCMGAASMPAQPEPSKPDKPAAQPEDKPDQPRERPKRAKDDRKPSRQESRDDAGKDEEGGDSLITALAKARASARQVKDATQVRGIHQGLVMFAQNNSDEYPRPSKLDKLNTTIKSVAHEKDTTSNIMSIMIYNGFFGPELCVSPAECNKAIKLYKTYAYNEPKAAAKPAQALWDPGFSADFTRAEGGNFSYAHLMPSESRLPQWSNTFSATEAAVGNRGPRIEALQLVNNKAVPILPEKSNTYKIHGGPTTWEGNIAFNDNHVEFVTEMVQNGVYVDKDKKKHPDNFFFDENDDPADVNSVLGIYTRSGHTTDFFKGIWD